MFDFSANTGLAGLFVASFVSATLLPGGSELVLLGVIEHYPAALWPALGVATAGNTLGGLTSYAIGRLLPNRFDAAGPRQQRALERLRRFGPAALLLSWLPVVGDVLCVAAGWLRLRVGWSALAIAAGKFARYAALAFGWRWLVA
jgi:membrane protein YqaA with SNARE-associated domain